MRKLAILGSTGSIGRNVLDLVRRFPGQFQAIALAAGENAVAMAEQVQEFDPQIAALSSRQAADELVAALRARGHRVPQIEYGPPGLIAVAGAENCDVVVSAITGAAGLLPTYHAVCAGKRIALANKETLVVAGQLIMKEARRSGCSIVPVDSEHSALHQCLQGRPSDQVARLVLTASGGPFWSRTREHFAEITLSDALRHPTWKMGPKVTIDSATLMNKGLEVIEAMHLFDVPASKVRILIHPQSLVHSLVELIDGTFLAQLGVADMRAAILYALVYPERWDCGLPRLDLTNRALEFFDPDFERFPCPRLAYRAAEAGGTAPAVLNAANEVAVHHFLCQNLAFTQIPEVIEQTLEKVATGPAESIEEYLEADRRAREVAEACLSTKAN